MWHKVYAQWNVSTVTNSLMFKHFTCTQLCPLFDHRHRKCFEDVSVLLRVDWVLLSTCAQNFILRNKFRINSGSALTSNGGVHSIAHVEKINWFFFSVFWFSLCEILLAYRDWNRSNDEIQFSCLKICYRPLSFCSRLQNYHSVHGVEFDIKSRIVL